MSVTPELTTLSASLGDVADDISVLAEPPKRRRTALFASIVVGLVVMAFVVVAAQGEPRDDIVPPTPLSGKPAPAVSGETLAGDDFTLPRTPGTFVFVNFFGSWCAPCRDEHDDLVRFSESPDTAGLATVVGITNNESADASRAWLTGRGGDWPIIADEDGSFAVDFGVRGLPETFVLAPDGTVIGRFYGGVTDVQLLNVLRQLVAASVPTDTQDSVGP